MRRYRRMAAVIADERCVVYLNSLDRGNTDFLNEIEKKALADRVPIIRRQTQSLLRFLLEMNRPLKILEVGTAIGFSALLMAEYTDAAAHITTIEKFEKRIPIARANFEAAGDIGKKIELKCGDAADILKELADKHENGWDFIFMDAAKAQYINFYPYVLRLLKKGGLLMSDNVLQDGDIIESKFAVTRRDRTIHKRMRQYLEKLSDGEDFVTTILDVGDGIALSVKK